MRVSENMSITKRNTDNAYYGIKNGLTFVIEPTDPNYIVYDKFYNMMRSTAYANRESAFQKILDTNRFPEIFGEREAKYEATEAVPEITRPSAENIMVNALKHLIDFFSEFAFTPSFRFTNTFAYMAAEGKQRAMDYVDNYFSLMDSSYVREVRQKMLSTEFSLIVKDIAQYGLPKNHVNTRLKIYFGPAGTGKTTIAQNESDNRCIVCNSSMLPSDLMEDFIFKDGNPDFNPSLLWDCMEQGKTIVLDEINLLPFDSLRFLQGIVDGKSEFYYKNRPVHIADGFQIIGTMNLAIGGMVYGLPEPLVDRCAETKQFVLTAEQLAKAITGWDTDTEGE